MSHIRNFCIIAHIDHGKSTLADRFIELTGTVPSREMRSQLLDQMDLEREKGITIKLQPVTMSWKGEELNLIDTPGHVDFNYEVSRSLAAVEGAILLVDATQGIQAQTISNLFLALEQNLTIIPVINKIDLPAADVAATKKEIISLLGCTAADILLLSAKTGEGVSDLLDAIIERVKPPLIQQPERALIFDSIFNEYKGIIVYVRLFGGNLQAGDKILFVSNQQTAEILEVGRLKPQMQPAEKLVAGEIGYVISNVKMIESARVGDTICPANKTPAEPLPGFKKVKPMVYAGIFPEDGADYNHLRDALHKLKLNDSSLQFEVENSPVLGFGFRCGFLGLLHLEIFQERLLREFAVRIIVTSPSVAYKVSLHSGEERIVTAPALLPDLSTIEQIFEPTVIISVLTPKDYMGTIMNYIAHLHATLKNTTFLDERRVIIQYHLPLSEILTDFYDKIKNISSGYASYNYELADYVSCDVVKLDILVAEELVPALTSLVYREAAYRLGKNIVTKLKELIPKKQFVIKLQAVIGGKIVASERIPALRKDVTAKLYGGDVTRKRKLLEKQKKGKKKMMAQGRVEIPTKAYLSLLQR
ncbi:MAG: translation elongation factor 4 [Candidatus Komeilibacteria bacterium]